VEVVFEELGLLEESLLNGIWSFSQRVEHAR
jgi:hypothetical protein